MEPLKPVVSVIRRLQRGPKGLWISNFNFMNLSHKNQEHETLPPMHEIISATYMYYVYWLIKSMYWRGWGESILGLLIPVAKDFYT